MGTPRDAHQAGAASRTLREIPATDRWVASVGNTVPRSRHGLVEEDALDAGGYADQHLRRAADLCGGGSYVLLAPGQSGKTTVLRGLQSVEPDSVLIDLRLFSGASLESVVCERAQDRSVVYVDALDEALRADPNAGYQLAEMFNAPWARAVRWRIACRPGFWDPAIVSGLDVEEIELLPLHEGAVRALAGDAGAQFLTAIATHSLTRLLPLAGQTRALLDQWEELGTLPSSGMESLAHTIDSLLVDQRVLGGRGQRQSLEQMRTVAEHLAALTVFCGKVHFRVGPRRWSDADSVMAAVEVPPAPPKGGAIQIETEQVREVLDTSLFAAAGGGTVAFAHQSYADYLAAYYLKRNNVVGRRLASLLGATTNGLVPPAMQEVVAWLLAIGASVPDEITQHNAKELLRAGGLELTSDAAREALVDAVLGLAAARVIDEGWGVSTADLAHPGLAGQLGGWLAKADNDWTMFWICRIARQCVVTDYAPSLLSIALDSRWSNVVRTEAVEALSDVVGETVPTELLPLMDLPVDEDPDDRILGATLRAMTPRGTPAERIVKALRAPRVPNFIGGYQIFLAELDRFVRPDDALTVLSGIMAKATMQDHWFDDAAARLVSLVWSAHDLGRATALGALLGSDLKARSFVFRRDGLPWESDPDDDLRREMGLSALSSGEHAFVVVSKLRMLLPKDMGWLLDRLGETDGPIDGSVAVLLRELAWQVGSATTADRILSLAEDHPAFPALESTRGVWRLEQKPEGYEPKVSPEVRTQCQQHLADLREQLTAAEGDPGLWWSVANLLADHATDDLVTWDLTRRSYWTELEASEQTALIACGLIYVTRTDPTHENWADAETWSFGVVMRDWSAVFLLATLAVHWPDLAQTVPAAVWIRWAPVIVAVPPYVAPTTSDDGGSCWQRQIWAVGDEDLRRALADAMCDRIVRGSRTDFEGHPLTNLTDTDILTAVTEVALDRAQPYDRREAAHRVLAAQNEESGLDVALHVFEVEDPCSLEVVNTIGRFAPARVVRRWMEAGHLGPAEHVALLDPRLLEHDELVWIAGALLEKYPFSADTHSAGGGVSPAENARTLRTRCIQLMVERGLAGDLESMLVGRDERDQDILRHFLYQARIEETRSKWSPLAPKELMGLLAVGDARLIRGPAHLLDVLHELLDEFQHELHHRGAYSDVWDGDPTGKASASKPKPKPKPKSEDTVSDRIQRYLESRLTTTAVDRELQVTRKSEHGVGTRIDLTLTAPGDSRPVRVLIEAKHVHNPEVPTAIDDQLAARYLDALKLTHGLYLVYWVAPDHRASGSKSKHPNLEQLRAELQEQANRLKPELNIDAYVLDIGPPT